VKNALYAMRGRFIEISAPTIAAMQRRNKIASVARQSGWEVSIYPRNWDSNWFAEKVALKLGLAGCPVSI